jgi:hypothetical protein
MQYTIHPDILDAAHAVRLAVAAAYADHACETAANEAVASGSPVVALAEGLHALWAVRADLNEAELNALASAAHFVSANSWWARGGDATAVLLAISAAEDVASITGGPAVDARFIPPEPNPPTPALP